MKNLTKRLLSIVLAVVMVVALLPANILSVFAVAPESISLYAPLYQYDKDEGTGKLSVGQQITAKAKDADGKFIDAQNITFTTSDPTVVTVDASGVMTGVHSGTATVTAAHKEDEAVNASLTVTVTNVSTYVLGLEAFNVGIVNSDGTLDYGQNLAGNYGFSATYSPAYWTDHDATNFIPFQLSSTTGEHSYATGKDYVISRVGVGWYLRATDYTNTVKIANMAYSNTTYSAPWAFGRGFETGVSNRGWDFMTTFINATVTQSDLANDAYSSYLLKIPAAGTYDIAFNANAAFNMKVSFYMVPQAESNNFNTDRTPYKIKTVDMSSSASVVMEAAYTAESAGNYYFIISTDESTVTSGNISMTPNSIVLTLDEIHEPVLNGGNSISVNGSAHYSVTQDKDSFDTPQTITDVSYSIINGKDYVELVSDPDGTASVVGVAAGTATLQASFTGIDGKSYTKTVDITVQPARSAFYRFNLKAFNVGNPQNDGSVITTQLADDKTTMSAAWTDTSAEHFLEFDVTQNAKPVWVRTNHKLWYLYYMNASANGHVSDPTFKYQRTLDTTNGYGTDPWYLHNYSGISSGYMDTNYIYMSLAGSAYICLVVDVPATGTYKITPDVTGSPRTFYMAPTSVDIADIETAVDTQGEPLYRVGSMASGETGKSFTKELTGGLNYFFVRFTDVITNNYATSLSLEPDIITHTVATDTTNLSVGSSATITATKNGTVSGTGNLEITAAESSDPGVARVFVSNSSATVTAIAEGSANVTVKYIDSFGITHTKVITYTVSAAQSLFYRFATTSYNIGVDANGSNTGEIINFADSTDCVIPGSETKVPSVLVLNPDYIDYDAEHWVPYHTSNANGSIWCRTSGENNWRFYPIYSNYSSNKQYFTSYDYLNTIKTSPWQWTSYNANITASQTYLTTDSNYVQFGALSSTPYGYVTLKIMVPQAGTYSIDLQTSMGSSSNYKLSYFLTPVIDGQTETKDTLTLTDNLIGSFEYRTTSGDEVNTFNSCIKNGSSTIGFTSNKKLNVTSAGEYYLTVYAETATGKAAPTTTGNLQPLESITLTPVPVDLDGYTVQREAVLSDDIRMEFHVTPTGSLIDRYDVYVEDQKIGNVPVETGVKKTIAVSLCASQMSKIITLQPVDGNGDNIGTARTYSLRTYLLDVINETHGDYSDEMVTLAKYTYNYGAKAQINANRDTDRLVDNITVEDKLPGTYEGNALTGSTEGIAAKTATLVLENNIRVRVYFELAAGYDIANFTFTKGETALTPVASGNRYYVEVDNINPQMYKDDVVISVKNAGAGDLTVTYSPMDYIQRAYANANAKAELKDLVVALNGYHEAAVAYRIAYPTDPVA